MRWRWKHPRQETHEPKTKCWWKTKRNNYPIIACWDFLESSDRRLFFIRGRKIHGIHGIHRNPKINPKINPRNTPKIEFGFFFEFWDFLFQKQGIRKKIPKRDIMEALKSEKNPKTRYSGSCEIRRRIRKLDILEAVKSEKNPKNRYFENERIPNLKKAKNKSSYKSTTPVSDLK